uniref:Uncharacterized protein n=1 Tax=Periophthalmus magnuspinnatus TaxID=409849 RepID=A0A3B3ZSF8_9GOBI
TYCQHHTFLYNAVWAITSPGAGQPCTRDVECCDDHTCVWGQCTESASKGDAGSTCQTQSDCNPDLCCAFHKALLFPICLSKPIEREQCFSASNHLMELLSRDPQDEGPRKHCPCVGDLHYENCDHNLYKSSDNKCYHGGLPGKPPSWKRC